MITEGSIKKFLSYIGKSETESSDVLQVLSFKVTEGKINGDIYWTTLSDSLLKFERFFLPKKHGGDIKIGDFVKIVLIQKAVSNGKVFFKVLKYEVVGFSQDVIGNPCAVDQEVLNNAVNMMTSSSNTPLKNTFSQESNENNENNKKDTGISQVNAENVKSSCQKSTHLLLNTLSTFTKDLFILVRCIKKYEKKQFRNNKGSESSVFNFVIIDKEKTQMQVSCFNKTAERLCSFINEGSIYEIIGGYIKLNDHKYNSTKTDYMIALNEDSIVNQIVDNFEIPTLENEIVPLASISSLKLHTSIDVLVKVINCNEKSSVKSKYGQMSIRKLIVFDLSNTKVELTLWKQHADLIVSIGDVLLLKKVKIGEYSGRNISASDDSVISVNPSIPILQDKINQLNESSIDDSNVIDLTRQAAKGDDLYSKDSQGTENKNENIKKQEGAKLSSLLEAYNIEDKVHKVKVYATQFNNNEKNIYAGCPLCRKKLLTENGSLTCPTCKKVIDNPQYYFTISIRFKDYSSDQWIDHFGLVAEKILKTTANDYKKAIDINNSEYFNRICENVEFNCFILTVKSKSSSFNVGYKKKLNCLGVERVDIDNEARRMLVSIEGLLNKD